MDPNRTLLLVGGKTKIVQKAKRLGLDVVLFQAPDQLVPDQQTLADAVVLVNYTNWAELGPLARSTHDAWPAAAVLSLTEPGLDPAARVNDQLALGGTSYEVSHRFTNKWLMRQHLMRIGAATIPATLVSGPETISDFGREHGFPIVVKPADLTASLGVFVAKSAADVARVWRQVCALRQAGAHQWAHFFKIGDFMAEPYVPGPEYSVEGFSFGGRHVVVAVTEKTSLDGLFVEVAHAIPAQLDADIEAAIVNATIDFLDAMGYTDGPTHTEVKLGPHGPVVLESHNRVGGDRINELVEAAYGIDLDTYAIGWPFRLVDELPDRPPAQRGAATMFFFGNPGRVATIEGVERVRAHPAVAYLDINVRVGDVVEPVRGNWDRLGQVVATGVDAAWARRTCEELVRQIEFTTTAA